MTSRARYTNGVVHGSDLHRLMPDPGTLLSAGLARWVGTVHRRAGLVLLGGIALSALSVFYAKSNFAIDTDPDEMLSKELPYRQKGAALAEAFPQYPNSMVVVVDGPNADLVERAADELNAAIAERPDLFASVYDPQGMPFFRKNGLLFFDEEELGDLVDRLAEAQPLLGTLWTDPSLPGLLDVLRRAVEEARKGNAPARGRLRLQPGRPRCRAPGRGRDRRPLLAGADARKGA